MLLLLPQKKGGGAFLSRGQQINKDGGLPLTRMVVRNSLPAHKQHANVVNSHLRPIGVAGGAWRSTDLGAALMMLSTLRIISAASEALSSTWRFTWKDSVTPSADMSPTVPSDMSASHQKNHSSPYDHNMSEDE